MHLGPWKYDDDGSWVRPCTARYGWRLLAYPSGHWRVFDHADMLYKSGTAHDLATAQAAADRAGLAYGHTFVDAAKDAPPVAPPVAPPPAKDALAGWVCLTDMGGQPVRVQARHIAAVLGPPAGASPVPGTRMVVAGYDGMFRVAESPDEVMAMIAAAS